MTLHQMRLRVIHFAALLPAVLGDAAALFPRPLASADLIPQDCSSTTSLPCSGHGVCTEAARCACDRGFSGAACARPDYLFACPSDCSAPSGGRCISGRCICHPGRSGDDCADLTPVNCTSDCSGHGACAGGLCRCRAGYYGPSCAQGCPGYVEQTGGVCSGRGVCVAIGSPGHSLDRCKCHVGFEGDGCERDIHGVTTCPHACSGHGVCARGRCTCETRFAGHDCSIELRHGRIARALDSVHARIGATVVCFALSAIGAMLALRYINQETTQLGRGADSHGVPLQPMKGIA